MSIEHAVDDDCNDFIAFLGFIIYPAYGTHDVDDLVYLSSTALPNVVFPPRVVTESPPLLLPSGD